MAEKEQDAAIENDRRESKAEAVSFTFASIAVSGLPVFLVILTVALLIAGQDTAAIVSGIFALTSAGPQIITAIRAPRKKDGA